jgi:hypothetical protein
MSLPAAAEDVVAVLSAPGLDFPRNVLDTKALQYWGDVSAAGSVEIGDVAEGTYRLTVYATGEPLPPMIRAGANHDSACRCLRFVRGGRHRGPGR